MWAERIPRFHQHCFMEHPPIERSRGPVKRPWFVSSHSIDAQIRRSGKPSILRHKVKRLTLEGRWKGAPVFLESRLSRNCHERLDIMAVASKNAFSLCPNFACRSVLPINSIVQPIEFMPLERFCSRRFVREASLNADVLIRQSKSRLREQQEDDCPPSTAVHIQNYNTGLNQIRIWLLSTECGIEFRQAAFLSRPAGLNSAGHGRSAIWTDRGWWVCKVSRGEPAEGEGRKRGRDGGYFGG